MAREILRTGSFHYRYPSLKNLPIVATLFLPFARFERDTSDVLFLLFGIACYLAAFALALRRLARSRRQKLFALVLFASSRSFYVSLKLGQLSVPCFLLLVAALTSLLRGREGRAGVWSGLAFALKIPPGLLLPWFALRRRRRAAAAWLLTTALVLAASLAWFGVSLHGEYWDMVIAKNAGRTLTAGNNASLSATAMRLARATQPRPRDDLNNWRMIPIPPAGNALLALATAALLGGLGWMLWRRDAPGPEALALEFSMVICASLAAFPVAWDHYFLFLVIPLFVTGRAIGESGRGAGRAALWAACFTLANLPVADGIGALAGRPEWRMLRAAIPAAPLLAALGLLVLAARQHGGLAAGQAAGASGSSRPVSPSK